MTNAELSALASRVEGLKGPDREVDALVRCAVFAPAAAYVEQSPINGAWCVYEVGYNGKPRIWEPRNLSHDARTGSFTASLDAALTLVPEGWVVGQMSWWREDRSATCHMDNKYGLKACSGADTLPIALTAAALRAVALTKLGRE